MLKESQVTRKLIYPRYIGWLLRLVLTFFAADTFGLDVSADTLVPFLMFDLIYLGISHHFLLRADKFNEGLFFLLLLDNACWITWLSLTGGATNAFISSLLIPIAIAAVALPVWGAALINMINCSAYSLMLYFETESGHMAHVDMSAHYLGMWLNFILSACVINISLSLISQKLRRRDKQLSLLRESQLRQEQLVALGASSAQMAHQLATPLCSMRLWLDELSEQYSQQAVAELSSNLSHCEQSLQELRLATDAIRDGKKQLVQVRQFIEDVKRKTQLLLPEAAVSWSASDIAQQSIKIDQGVLPAVLTLIDNAQKASVNSVKTPEVEINTKIKERYLYIDIRDYGTGIDESLAPYLGKRFVRSPDGLGIALALTHAGLERNNGRLILRQHPRQGSIASVIYPLAH